MIKYHGPDSCRDPNRLKSGKYRGLGFTEPRTCARIESIGFQSGLRDGSLSRRSGRRR